MTDHRSSSGSAELLPCPFCGGDQLKISPNKYDGLLRVQCEKCWATSVTSNQRSTVVTAWNTRAVAQAPRVSQEVGFAELDRLTLLQAENERLRAALKQLLPTPVTSTDREYDPDVAPCDDAEFGMRP